MSETTIVPFVNVAAKRANDDIIDRIKGAPANPEGGNPNIDAVENILRAMEGMQAQIQAVTDLVIEQDKRIERLEKAKPGRIIRGLGS